MRGAQVNTITSERATAWEVYGVGTEQERAGDNHATMHAAMHGARAGDTIRLHSYSDGIVMTIATFANSHVIVIEHLISWEFIIEAGLRSFFEDNASQCTTLIIMSDQFKHEPVKVLLLKDYLNLLSKYEFAQTVLDYAKQHHAE